MKEEKKKLYPTCKFLIVCLYSACALILSSFPLDSLIRIILLAGWFIIVIVMGYCSGVLKEMLKALKAVAVLSVIIALFQLLFVKNDMVVFQIGIISICEIGINSAVTLGFSVLNIAGVFIWFFQTTKDKEIAYALETAGVSHKVAYIFISTLKMVDILGHNSKTIMNSQRARGVETEGNVLIRAKAFVPSLIPLILGAITSTEERVLTLECKGFSVEAKRTHIFEIEKNGKENLINAGMILITAAMIAGRLYVWIR